MRVGLADHSEQAPRLRLVGHVRVGHDGHKIATDQREEGLCVPEGLRGMNGESLHRQGHVDGFDNHRYVVNNDDMPGRSLFRVNA